jgi:hypothetical protein
MKQQEAELQYYVVYYVVFVGMCGTTARRRVAALLEVGKNKYYLYIICTYMMCQSTPVPMRVYLLVLFILFCQPNNVNNSNNGCFVRICCALLVNVSLVDPIQMHVAYWLYIFLPNRKMRNNNQNWWNNNIGISLVHSHSWSMLVCLFYPFLSTNLYETTTRTHQLLQKLCLFYMIWGAPACLQKFFRVMKLTKPMLHW